MHGFCRCAVVEMQHAGRVFLLRRKSAAKVVQREFVRTRSVREAAREQRRKVTYIQVRVQLIGHL